MNDLSNKTAVVIGGGSGVGEGICLRLAKQGVNVVVADLDLNSAERVKDKIVADGTAIAVQVDSTDLHSLQLLADETILKYESIDILVNTVGVILERRLVDVSVEDWDWIWKLNVTSQINSVNVFLKYLKKSKKAHLILTASGAGFVAPPVTMSIGAYSTTKHALVGYAKNLRNELENDGISVSLLCPSGVEGNLAATSAKSYQHSRGMNVSDFGGKQPGNRQLEDNLIIGQDVLDAIVKGDFLISNKKDSLLEAIDEECKTLK